MVAGEVGGAFHEDFTDGGLGGIDGGTNDLGEGLGVAVGDCGEGGGVEVRIEGAFAVVRDGTMCSEEHSEEAT